MRKILSVILLGTLITFFVGCSSSGGGGSNTTPAPLSSAKAITAFSFASPAAVGTITESTHSIAITVPSGTNVTALIPTITYTGASISPASGVAQNFTNPVKYTVTAADSSTQDYTVTVTVTVKPFTAAFNIEHVATDGNIIIATTGNWPGTGSDANIAVAFCFNSDGTILWQSNTLPGLYGKSQIVNGNLYAIRTNWSSGITTIYIDKIDVNTGAITTAVVNTYNDLNNLTSLTAGGVSLAVSNNAIYVVALNNVTSGRTTLSKFDLSLASKTVLYSNDTIINDMDFTVAGNYIYQIEMTGSGSEIDAFTTAGVYFGVMNYPETFHNTLANGNRLYISGMDNASDIATIFIYDLDANPVKSISLVQVGGAYGMAFGPSGEMYVAMSNNAKGPVRLNLSTGNISWTGTDSGTAIVYCNSKVFLATGGNELSVYDATTGNHLN